MTTTGPNLAVEFDPDIPDFGDGDGGDIHARCAEAFLGFLVLLTARVQDRSPLLGRMLESEIEGLLESYTRNGESKDA